MATVRVNLKNIANVNKRLEGFFKKIIGESLLNEIGKFWVERIKAFTRSGKSIAGEKPKKLKKLSESYKHVRRGALKFRTINGRRVPFPEPDERLQEVDTEFFEPDFSNLTFTGQMLRSLTFSIDSVRKRISLLFNPDVRRGKYEKLSNEEVAKFVTEQGRPFRGLDDNGIARVKALILKEIRAQLKKQNLRR